jgi:transposase
MLKPKPKQTSFYDTDAIADPLLPPDSFHRQFRELVWPLIQDQDFESIYCIHNGRPAISPALLAMALILQYHENLSDREMEAACRYDLRLKYALGLGIDERPFDHSSLGDFRDRLLKHEKEKAVFDRILESLIAQGLIAKDESQRIDATHVIADIAIPSMITLVKKGIYEILKPVAKRHAETHRRIADQVHLAPYSKAKVNENHPGRPDEVLRTRVLVQAVRDARTILREVESITGDPILDRRVQLLKRILQENIENDASGTPKEKDYKAKPKDLLVSPVDPDARYGAKSATKRFTGYKANVTETVHSRFITNIKAMRGNRPDGETMVAAVADQKSHNLVPAKLIGDTAYGDGAYRKALGEAGTQVVAPQHAANPRTRAVYPKSAFQHDESANTLTCPNGVTVKAYYYDTYQEMTMFHFPKSACGECSHRPRCTQTKEARRVVGISAHNKELREAELYNQTEQFKQDMRLRPAVEGKLSELVRYHGLRRARYRGLNKVSLQFYFTAAAVNVKRWMKQMRQRRSPVPEAVPA